MTFEEAQHAIGAEWIAAYGPTRRLAARRSCARDDKSRAVATLITAKRASRMLAEICGWFTEGFDTRDLKDAKALLDELSD